MCRELSDIVTALWLRVGPILKLGVMVLEIRKTKSAKH